MIALYNANDYPELWKILPDNVKDTTNNTFVIDMCETVLVGAGTSGRSATELNAHDIYTLGEFKDDQMQGHWHASPELTDYYVDWNSKRFGPG